jgi:hypothetical protein
VPALKVERQYVGNGVVRAHALELRGDARNETGRETAAVSLEELLLAAARSCG